MDRTGIIVVTLCAILLGFWFVGQQKYAQQQAAFMPATNQAARAQSPFAAASSNAGCTGVKHDPRGGTPCFRHQHAGGIAGSSPMPACVTRSLRAAAG